jgi:HEPN domain-containing protein
MPSPEELIGALVREWVRKAEDDRLACITLLKESCDLGAVAAFHAQQMAEKYLKALLTWRQIEFPKTHSIAFLLTTLERSDPGILRRIGEARLLTRYAISARYPGDEDRVTEVEAGEALKVAEGVRALVLEVVGEP